MGYTISKISNYGCAHPVVARLVVQTQELLKWASLSEEERGAAFDIYYGLKGRLIKCHETYDRLSAALKKSFDGYQPDQDSTIKFHPLIIGIDNELETFLYESKNFLRDLLGIVKIFFDTKFIDANVFYNTKTDCDGELIKWATKTFGPTDPFTKMLVSDQPWIGELIRKRNAIEHPGGKSGTLNIINIEQSPDSRYVLPVWHRDSMNPTGIFPDVEVTLDNLLTLAEEMLVHCITHKNHFGDFIAFSEIAES
ncbi:MAG: hypothetical protein Q7U56_06765, partial [Humidesulfovibrio sp.]|nr:hypothetical protein [Humidesulfovibrio sp.]